MFPCLGWILRWEEQEQYKATLRFLPAFSSWSLQSRATAQPPVSGVQWQWPGVTKCWLRFLRFAAFAQVCFADTFPSSLCFIMIVDERTIPLSVALDQPHGQPVLEVIRLVDWSWLGWTNESDYLAPQMVTLNTPGLDLEKLIHWVDGGINSVSATTTLEPLIWPNMKVKRL